MQSDSTLSFLSTSRLRSENDDGYGDRDRGRKYGKPYTISSNISASSPTSENVDGEEERTTTMESPTPLSPLSDDGIDYGPYGETILEVFSVCFENINQQCQGRLYGEIKVHDGVIVDHIYNQNRENAQSISSGDNVLLIGPSKTIVAYDGFYFDVALTYKYNNCLFDDEVIFKETVWSSFHSYAIDEYDKPLLEKAQGLYGWVVVNYAVFRNAVVATLEVFLINGDEEIAANVYGNITARYSKFMDKRAKSLLFRKKLEEGIDVRSGQLIPLSRSVVGVPRDDSLVIEANLWDSFDGDEIAKGVVEFSAQSSGIISEKNMSAKCGQLKVKVPR